MRNSTRINVLLWCSQVLLAALFLFAGSVKFLLPDEQLTAGSPFTAGFIHFIGVAEILGALGLILPGLTRIWTRLTPVAASGLAVIMAGATITTLGGGAGFLIPLATVLLAAFVAWGRWRVPPVRHAS